MKRYISLVLVALMVLGLVPGGAWGDEPYERIQYLFSKIDELNANGIYSDDEVSCVLVDLSNISINGSVTSYVYENTNNPVIKSFTSRTITKEKAVSNMTRYILGDIRTTYIEPPFNCSVAMSVYERESIPVYVYGDGKSYCIEEIEQALPKIFEINYSSGGGSGGRSSSYSPLVPDKPIELPIAKRVITAMFSIGNNEYSVTTDDKNPEVKLMDVTPDIIDGRTYIPIRYLANSLGVNDIEWNENTETTTLKNKDTSISLTIGSNIMKIKNGEESTSITMDAIPYIKQGRTMLPAKWVAEPLGAKIEWDESAHRAKIKLIQEVQK